jgi:hypothetical protein
MVELNSKEFKFFPEIKFKVFINRFRKIVRNNIWQNI